MDEQLLFIALAGFFASVVDGALGMGFGPTSSTILLSSGVPAPAASAMVNLAKVVTGAAGGISHWRLGNVDRRLVARLAVPGIAGAVIGTTVLTSVDGDALRPVLAVLLVLVGIRILVRFSRPLVTVDEHEEPSSARGVEVAGAAGGVTNGLIGAWGPVVTPFLLQRGVAPRIAVGSVNTAEVAVAVTAVGSLLTGGGSDGVRLAMVVAMLSGGVVAAPLAAVTIRHVPARVLGLAVGALLLLTQTRELLGSGLVPGGAAFGYPVVLLAVALAAVRPHVERDEPVTV